jgi:uncharacterized protein DUF1254
MYRRSGPQLSNANLHLLGRRAAGCHNHCAGFQGRRKKDRHEWFRLLLHVPDTHGRYFVMQLLDAWTETFDLPGKRARGTGARWFGIVGPGWKGTLPPHIEKIMAPTNTVYRPSEDVIRGRWKPPPVMP